MLLSQSTSLKENTQGRGLPFEKIENHKSEGKNKIKQGLYQKSATVVSYHSVWRVGYIN